MTGKTKYVSKLTGEVTYSQNEAMELYRAGHEIEVYSWSETLQEEVLRVEWTLWLVEREEIKMTFSTVMYMLLGAILTIKFVTCLDSDCSGKKFFLTFLEYFLYILAIPALWWLPMIIKFTVRDNDYHYILKSFIDSLWKGIGMYGRYINSVEEYIAEEDLYNKFLKLTSPHNKEYCNEEDIEFITYYIKHRLETYVKCFIRKEDYRKSMLDGFEVGVYSHFVDKWENGENFYWFQHSRAVICQ